MIGPASPPRVSVITVTYRSVGELPACLESLDRQQVPLELFLVDNASPDATPELVRVEAARHENVHAILNRENRGLAFANNQPLGRLRGEYVLILNPDTALRDGALAGLVRYLETHPEVVAVGPKNVYEDGTPHSSYHKSWTVGHVMLWRLVPYALVRRLHDRNARYRETEVRFVSGACLLMRREAFERIGGYDPQYFLTVEDACDLCIRASRAGGKVVYYPAVEVMHLCGRSSAGVSFLVTWESLRGAVYHFHKHHGVLAGLLVTAIFLLNHLVRSLLVLIATPLRPRLFPRIGRYAELSWKLVAESPMLKRNHHTFA